MKVRIEFEAGESWLQEAVIEGPAEDEADAAEILLTICRAMAHDGTDAIPVLFWLSPLRWPAFFAGLPSLEGEVALDALQADIARRQALDARPEHATGSE